MPEYKAHENIRKAEELVRNAAAEWSAVDLCSIGNCVGILERSADHLTSAFTTLQESPETTGSALRDLLLNITEDASRLQRLVDASAAFLRGLPGADSADQGFYQPGGVTRHISSASETWGMQG